jgi:type IV secretory pathway TraG/TraD family ATPase VirD4
LLPVATSFPLNRTLRLCHLHLPPTCCAANGIRINGLQLWPIVQDIHQLRSLYGTSAGTFLSNAGVLQAFGVNDYDTGGQSAKDIMVKDPERSVSKARHLATRNLMDPNEIMKLAPDTLLLLRVGKSPLIVKSCYITRTGNLRGYLILNEWAGHIRQDFGRSSGHWN